MYKIYVNGRPSKANQVFFSYDDARNFARKLIRKRKDYLPMQHGLTNKYLNPCLQDWGFEIRSFA